MEELSRSRPAAPLAAARIEDKYLLPPSALGKALALLAVRLAPDFPDPRTRFTLIESIYLDSTSLRLFRDHFLSPSRRFKLRTRRYAANGAWDPDHALLELKRKDGRSTFKTRRSIGAAGYRALLEGRPIGRGGKKLRKLERIIRAHGLLPACAVRYRRHAFGAPGIRITIDDSLSTEPLREVIPPPEQSVRSLAARMREGFLGSGGLVLEVKRAGQAPDWLEPLLLEFGARKAAFSKYCFAVAEALGPALAVEREPASGSGRLSGLGAAA